jgi:hypothetical protein
LDARTLAGFWAADALNIVTCGPVPACGVLQLQQKRPPANSRGGQISSEFVFPDRIGEIDIDQFLIQILALHVK